MADSKFSPSSCGWQVMTQETITFFREDESVSCGECKAKLILINAHISNELQTTFYIPCSLRTVMQEHACSAEFCDMFLELSGRGQSPREESEER